MPKSQTKPLDRLIHIGNMMANVCFNLKQDREFKHAQTCAELQRDWDAAMDAYLQEKKHKTSDRRVTAK